MTFDRQSLNRIRRSVRVTENDNQSNQINRRNRRGGRKPNNPRMRIVKTTVDTAANSVESFAVWADGADTGDTIDAVWGWGADGAVLKSGTECLASQVSGVNEWLIVGWDCSGVLQATPAPLDDPPIAVGTVDTATPNEVAVDSTGSAAASGQSLTRSQWLFILPGSEILVISGPPTSTPDYVYDSRGTLDIGDVGSNIAGNTNDLIISEIAGSLSAPYNITLFVTQTDGQQSEDAV